MSITARELAKKLNISASAVSLALNNKPGVSYETRKTVIQTAEHYGYDFTKLSKNKSVNGRSIYFILYKRHGAVVVNDSSFFAQLSIGIEESCKEFKIKLQTIYLSKSDDVHRQLEDIIYAGCMGIILLGTEMLPDDLTAFVKLSVPVVLLDVYYDTIKYSCISINNVQGAFLATDYLITKTKTQPGLLHSTYKTANVDERADGFYKAVREHGLSTSKSIVHRLTHSADGAFADMLAILDSGEDIASSYFAVCDWIAIGAMKAFQARGKKIPDDVAIIGFSDLSVAEFIDPPLTTIRIDARFMGEIAAKHLIGVINVKEQTQIKIEIMTNLIIRGSV